MTDILPIYLLPPSLSLICGVFLAVVALTRGRLNGEKILFALVCIWYSLLAPVFMSHHFIKDVNLIMTIERSVHFFYVYLPLVVVAFFHQLIGKRRHDILILIFIVSFLISLTTPTDFYITGLYRYNWGYIAKGGPAFQAFGLFGFAILIYCIVAFYWKSRLASNPRTRLKFNYICISFGMTAILTFCNLPAMLGYDFYPLGNFMFIPLTILAYGILKHRLMDIGTMLHLSTARVMAVLLIVAPNYLIYSWGVTRLAGVSYSMLFFLIALWFSANYLYVRWVLQVFDRWFFKVRHGLKLAEVQLIRELLELRDADALMGHVDRAIRSCLPFAWARVHIYDDTHKAMFPTIGDRFSVPNPVVEKLSVLHGIIEKDALGAKGPLVEIENDIKEILTYYNSAYAIPLIHKEAFIGFLMLPEKDKRLPMNQVEAAFLKSIAVTLAVALSNSLMFQRISTLKDNLQAHTDALTSEIAERKRVEADLKEVQHELQQANVEMEVAILKANEMRVKAELGNQELLKEIESRHRIEEALRKSEAMYRLLTDNSADVIWTVDLEDRFTYVSPSARDLLGYTSEEMGRMKISDMLTAQSYQLAKKTIVEDQKRLAKVGGRHSDRTLELEQVRKDGTTVWTEVNTRFFGSDDGAIQGIVGVTRDISRRRRTEQKLQYMAYHDALTGLYNRKAFIDLLDNEIKYAQRYKSGLSLLFIDLDKFKQANDTYGHGVGDQLLKAVAERLKLGIRETDLISRFGGDEFTIILRNPDKINSDLVAGRIVETISKPFHFGDATVDFIGCSIGIASCPKDGDTTVELMKNADLAMYEAKKGNADWVHFEAQMAKAS